MSYHIERVGVHNLTPKQDQVYNLLIQDLNYHQIGDIMGVTNRGVQFHVNNIFNLLDYSSRFELVADHYAVYENVKPMNLPKFKDKFHEDVFWMLIKGYKACETAELLGCIKSKVSHTRVSLYRSMGVTNGLDLLFKCLGVKG